MKGMILAAGFGTRLRPLTNYLPKPLFPILNTTVLKNNIIQLLKIGITDISINTHYLKEKIIDYIKTEFDFPINISIEEEKILGVGGGIGRMKKYFAGDDVLVINGDVLNNFDLKLLTDFYYKEKPFAALGLYNYPKVNSVLIDDENNIYDFKNLIRFPDLGIFIPSATRRILFFIRISRKLVKTH